MGFKLDGKLLKGSFILLVSFNLFNLLNFIFHFSMIRMLSVVDYGILATLFSILYMLGVFSESLQLIIVKYTSGESKVGKIKGILKKSFRKAGELSVMLFIGYALVSIILSDLLKINYLLMLMNGLFIFVAFFSPINRGAMQGMMKFKSLGGNMILEGIVKLGLAVLFVFFGWKVYGAIAGAVVGAIIAFVFSFGSLKSVIKSKEENVETSSIYGYSKPAFFIILIVLVFYSLDIILAKMFFSEQLAGSYAIASTLAKTIFFGTQPISKAMFPISAKDESKKKESKNVFLNAFFGVGLIVLVVLALFYFFPEFLIKVFSGEIINESISVLFYLGIGFGLVSITNLFLLYKLSMGKTEGYKKLAVFVVIEVLLLSYFSNNLVQFSLAFITSSAIFLWGALFLLKE